MNTVEIVSNESAALVKRRSMTPHWVERQQKETSMPNCQWKKVANLMQSRRRPSSVLIQLGCQTRSDHSKYFFVFCRLICTIVEMCVEIEKKMKTNKKIKDEVIEMRQKEETRPDTRQDSRERCGRGSSAKLLAFQKCHGRTVGRSDRPTNQGVESRVRD